MSTNLDFHVLRVIGKAAVFVEAYVPKYHDSSMKLVGDQVGIPELGTHFSLCSAQTLVCYRFFRFNSLNAAPIDIGIK